MKLIGLAGYKRAGKDSTAGFLAEYGFKRYALADQLRTMAYNINPWIMIPDSRLRFQHLQPIIDAIGWEEAKVIPDVRAFLQRLGTDGVRDVLGENAWIDALRKRLTDDGVIDDPTARVVITDCRFPNEADYVHSVGGKVWRIDRPGVGGDDPHPSEAFISKLPVDTIITATNLDELQERVRNAAHWAGVA